jgi:serine protease
VSSYVRRTIIKLFTAIRNSKKQHEEREIRSCRSALQIPPTILPPLRETSGRRFCFGWEIFYFFKEAIMNQKTRIFIILAMAAVVLIGSAVQQNVLAQQEEPQAAGTARVYVEFQPGRKEAVRSALQGVGAAFHYEFDDLNTFVVSLPQQALQGIARNPNVVMIEEDVPRYLDNQTIPYGIDSVQARDVWDANKDGTIDAGAPTGAGRLVCIIDSGLLTSHEDFAGVNVIGGYPSGWNQDRCGHGTHVAGTIAAAHNNLGVVGVTPGAASLYIVKVFGDTCSWSYSSTLVDAANRCDAAGANIISMSLGGGRSSRTELNAFNNLYNKGVLSVAAAGNAGNTSYSYPASYDSVISVAAVDINNVVADFSQKNNQVELAAPGVGVLSTVPWQSNVSVVVDNVTYQANQIEFAANGSATKALADGERCKATNSGWSGKVVLCERGDVSFYDKVRNVQNSGGAAAVIYNNEPGNFSGTLGSGNSSTIPAVSLSQEDGQYLKENKIGASTVVNSQPSTYPGSGYEAWSGTSMATPHVSGVAALVWSANTSWTNAQIREALQKTALDLGATGRDNSYGYGLVQAKAALNYLGGTVNQPPIASFTYSVSDLQVTFTDTSSDPDGSIVSWTWSFGDGKTSTAQNPMHTYAAGGSYTVTLTVTDNKGATGSTSQSVTVSQQNGNGIVLSATAYKIRGDKYADLTWSGAVSDWVDVYRNGVKITTIDNNGSYTDAAGKGGGSAAYKVCEMGTATCSNEVTVTW